MKQRAHAISAVDRCDEVLRLPIGADDEMLAIVEGDTIDHDAAGAAAKGLPLLEQRDRIPGLRQRHRGGEARPAGTDDRNPAYEAARAVVHAIQNLRNGVSAMR